MPSQIANYIHRVESKKRSLDDVARKSPPRSRLNASETCQHACSASVQTARPDDIRQLQQTAGNRAVEQLLAGYHLSPKDAMGGPRASTDLDDNLNLHDSADSHEVNPLEEGSLLGMGLQQRIDASRGAGGSLSSPIRQQMEHSLGTELADVRVHTDPSADTLAQAVNAQAFTTGRDIFFRRNAYRPETAAGRKVLAHELAHVVQQGSLKGGMNGSLRLGRRGDHLEQEADRTARAVAEHPGSAATAGRSAAGQVSAATVQRVYEESTPIPLDEHGPESESAADQESKATTPEEEQSRRYKWVRKGKMKWEQKLRKEKKGKKEKQENMFTVPKLPEYNEEETKGFMDAGTQHAPTYYHPGGQPNPYQTRVQGGLLKRGGKSMDTVGTIPQFAKDKANRHMFTMGAEGEMMTANVGANAAKHGPFHHTSMSGGGEVAAAGEMRVSGGKLDTIADSSGHYSPSAPMTYQALRSLKQQKVDLSHTGVELAPKKKGGGQKALQLSATEFMSYKPEMKAALASAQYIKERYAANPEKMNDYARSAMTGPEEQIRAAHDETTEQIRAALQTPIATRHRAAAEAHSTAESTGQRPLSKAEYVEAIKGTSQAASKHSQRMTDAEALQERQRIEQVWKAQNHLPEGSSAVTTAELGVGHGPEAEPQPEAESQPEPEATETSDAQEGEQTSDDKPTYA